MSCINKCFKLFSKEGCALYNKHYGDLIKNS